MKSEKIKIIILTILIIFSFFVGYLFRYRESEIALQELQEKPLYIDISTTKSSIKITQSPKNIFFRINGNIIQSGSIDLKE